MQLRPVLIIAALAALLTSAQAAAHGRGTLVPVGPHSSGFGRFHDPDAIGGDDNELRRLFGKPDQKELSFGGHLCTLRWRGPGVVADLATFGSETRSPCTHGQFIEARLSDRRWHTKSGVRPGSPKRAARRHSLRHCTNTKCGVRGYALELHHVDCTPMRVPGVIAEVRKGSANVSRLVVRWRGCE